MIHVMHIRKTGGSAIAHALAPYVDEYDIRLHGHGTVLSDISIDEPVVFAVRDPFSRFCSGFNSRLRCGRPRNNIPWTPSETIAFSQFQTPNELAEALTAAALQVREQAFMAFVAIPHLIPLTCWLGSINQLKDRTNASFILSTASLDDDFNILKRLIRLPLEAALPSDPIKSHATPAGFSRYLSPLGRQNLHDYYCDDHSIYRYCLRHRLSHKSTFLKLHS